MGIWQPLIDNQAGYLFGLSDSISIIEAENPGLLAPVATGTMIVASDYSGQHKEASHEAYSFLVTTDEALNDWLPLLSDFRERWLPDGRRISFKQLNEPIRRRALVPFLEAASNLSGNLITVLVDRRVGSLMVGGALATKDAFSDCFAADTNLGTVEKMFRLASFVALILAGLRREDQVSYWISDQDETLDSHERREQFARLATYLTFGVTGWRRAANHLFGTTGSSQVPFWSEDLAAIPDLTAGAYCRLSSFLPAFSSDTAQSGWLTRLASNEVEDMRARTVGNWLAKHSSALRQVLLRLELDADSKVRTSAQAFLPPHGATLI